jgi:hypothetical protein
LSDDILELGVTVLLPCEEIAFAARDLPQEPSIRS